jgi:hypothetical protein
MKCSRKKIYGISAEDERFRTASVHNSGTDKNVCAAIFMPSFYAARIFSFVPSVQTRLLRAAPAARWWSQTVGRRKSKQRVADVLAKHRIGHFLLHREQTCSG